MIRAKPYEVQVCVITASTQLGYACYVANLPAFMAATLSGKVTTISNRGYPINNVEPLLPWRLPSLIYDFKKAPSDTKIEELRSHSSTIKGRGKNISFIMEEPTLAKIQLLVRDHNPEHKTTHVIGTINIDAMRVVMVLQKILSLFLLTHVYPAFRHISDMVPNTIDRTTTTTKRRKTSSTTYLASVSETVDTWDQEEETKEGQTDPQPGEHANIVLTRAKPTKISGFQWGSIDNIPNSSGIYVPYVKELAAHDNLTVPTLISSYFLKCLAPHQNDMFKTYETIKSAWGVINSTELGDEITHMAKCIDIAIHAQAIVYPVYTDTIYEGSVICGAGYSLYFKGKVYEPVAYEVLTQMVSDASAHNRSLTEICAVIGDETCRLCDSMRSLATVVRGIRLDEISKQAIVKAASNLSYPHKYWSTSIHHIKRMMVYLCDANAEIPNDVPLHPTYLFTTDRVETVLAAFGHQAPTFMITNGSQFETKTKSTPPHNFHVRTVTLASAITDMKYIREKGHITNNTSNLSSKHRDTILKGADKTEVWTKLVEFTENETSETTDDDHQSEDDEGKVTCFDDMF